MTDTKELSIDTKLEEDDYSDPSSQLSHNVRLNIDTNISPSSSTDHLGINHSRHLSYPSVNNDDELNEHRIEYERKCVKVAFNICVLLTIYIGIIVITIWIVSFSPIEPTTIDPYCNFGKNINSTCICYQYFKKNTNGICNIKLKSKTQVALAQTFYGFAGIGFAVLEYWNVFCIWIAMTIICLYKIISVKTGVREENEKICSYLLKELSKANKSSIVIFTMISFGWFIGSMLLWANIIPDSDGYLPV